MLYLVVALVIIAAMCVPLALSIRSLHRHQSSRKALRVNLAAFGVVLLLCALMPFAVSAAEDAAAPADVAVADTAAPEAEAEAPAAEGGMSDGLRYLASALAVGLACIGGGIAVASAAPAAIGATSENPKAFAKSLIFVALGESIALYGLVISILILNS